MTASTPLHRLISLLAAGLLAGAAWAQAPAPAPSILPPPPAYAPPAQPYTPPPLPSFTPPPPVPPVPAAPLSTPAPATPEAAPTPAPSLEKLGQSLQNYFTEDELKLLFQYMQEAVLAAFKGEEVALAPDLAFKLEVLYVRIQKEGGQYMSLLMKQLERDLNRALKEQFAPKPPAGAPNQQPSQSQNPVQNPAR